MKGKAISTIEPVTKAGEISNWLEQLHGEVEHLEDNVARMDGALAPVCNYRGAGSDGAEAARESELCPLAEKIRSATVSLRISNGRLETLMQSIEL